MENSLKNMATNIGSQLLIIILGFIVRTVFIKTLGVQYLGITGLFTNIISVLNITELGFSSAIVFALYKPLIDNDKEKVKALVLYLKRVYRLIGFIVLALGLVFIPFIPYVITEKTDLININIVYLLFLARSVMSYFIMQYRTTILQADQKNFRLTGVRYLSRILLALLEISVLLIFNSFMVYLIIALIISALEMIISGVMIGKWYPYIKDKKTNHLSKEERREITRNIYGLSMYKVSAIVLNSTDNIIIARYIGLVAVGLYSNYLLLVSYVKMFLSTIFTSLTASIGNLNAVETVEKKHQLYKNLNFATIWIYGFCAICLWTLLQPFISLWIGNDYLLSNITVLLIVINFLSAGMNTSIILFKDACGVFYQGRYRPLISSILNIIISLLLVFPLGIDGVLLGTIISRFMVTWWFDPYLIYKVVFNKSSFYYYFRYLLNFSIIVLIGIFNSFICSLYGEISIINFLFMVITTALVPNIIFILLFYRLEEFKYFKKIIYDMLNKIFRRFKKS